MNTSPAPEPRFACDAMLGGLARWLRAAGYEASWRADINDWDLVRLARREKRLLLSSDTGIFRIGIIRDGEVASLFIPPGLKLFRQVTLVLQQLKLPLLPPRCMACGGPLLEVPKEQVRGSVPIRSFDWAERFWQCGNCQKIFWAGTHWQRIAARLHACSPQPE